MNETSARRSIVTVTELDVVDRTYQFLHTIFDEHTGSELLGWLAEHDPVPEWNAPRHTEAM